MLAVILIAISLSIDAFGIGTTYGMRKVKVKFMPKLIIALISFFITFLALSMGTQLQKILPDIITQIIGVGILFFMGASLILQSFKPEENNNNNNNQDLNPDPNQNLNITQDLSSKKSNKKNLARVYNINLKPFNLVIKIIYKPKQKKINNDNQVDQNNIIQDQKILSLTESFCMGFALSIDSIGSGIGLSLIGYNNFYLPVATAICQYIFLSLGIFLGDKISNLKINHRKFIFLSGLILIFFAALRII